MPGITAKLKPCGHQNSKAPEAAVRPLLFMLLDKSSAAQACHAVSALEHESLSHCHYVLDGIP